MSISLSYADEKLNHGIIGTFCEGIPVLVDTNSPSTPFVQSKQKNWTVGYLEDYIESPKYLKESGGILPKNIFYNYVLYVRKSIYHLPSTNIESLKKKLCQLSEEPSVSSTVIDPSSIQVEFPLGSPEGVPGGSRGIKRRLGPKPSRVQ